MNLTDHSAAPSCVPPYVQSLAKRAGRLWSVGAGFFRGLLEAMLWSVALLLLLILLMVASHPRALRWCGAFSTPDQLLLQGIKTGRPELVKEALIRGASANASDDSGMTAVMWAAGYWDESLVRRLIEDGADVSARSPLGLTAMSTAAMNCQEEVIQVLLDAGAEVDQPTLLGTALHYAVARPHSSGVALLLGHGADPNAADGEGHTPLMRLHAGPGEEAESAETLRLLLAAGADPNAADCRGRTALMYAAQDGANGLTALLLEAGVDPSLTDLDGNTAADLARENRHDAVADLLARESGSTPFP